MSYYSGTVNPVPKGGSSSSDARTGLGIGSLSKGPASGLGSPRSFGDALSSPRGEYDVAEEIDLLDDDSDIDKEFLDDEDFDIDASKIERKTQTSFQVRKTDSMSHKGTHAGYMGGIGADMSAVIGMSAGYSPKGNIISESCLKSYIKEIIMLEYAGMSGRISIKSVPKGKNLGDSETYSIDTTTSHTNKMNNDKSQKGFINHLGYTNQAKTPSLDPYVVPGKAVTDGSKTVYNSDLDVSFDDFSNMSTEEILRLTSTDEYRSEKNVQKKQKRSNIYIKNRKK